MGSGTPMDGERLAQALITLVGDIIGRYADELTHMAATGERQTLANVRHADNFLSEIDLRLHEEYRCGVAEILPAFLYISEEGEPQVYPEAQSAWPELAVIVDPLDASEMAVRGLSAHTHVSVYSLAQQAPLVSVVGDLFHHVQLYYAFRGADGRHRAYLSTRAGETLPLRCSAVSELRYAWVTNYLMRPRERFMKLAEQRPLLEALAGPADSGGEHGRIGVDSGSIGLCHVAAGFTDAMVEVAKGFKLWDLFPGQHILTAAGGVVAALDGTQLSLDLGMRRLADVKQIMETRRKFVAAGNKTLLQAIGGVLLSG